MKSTKFTTKTINQLPGLIGDPLSYNLILQGTLNETVRITVKDLFDSFESTAAYGLDLSRVDNTADLDKPISIATATALVAKANLINGILAEGNRQDIISIHLRDINFPTVGDLKRLYYAKDTGILYLYSSADSAYLPINETSSAFENYTHTVTEPEAVWVINHNLGKYPSVMVIDSTLTQVFGTIQFIDLNSLRITFSSPIMGIASLN